MSTFHLSAYFAALGVNAANAPLTFNAEDTFVRSAQNNLIVTEDYQFVAARYLAASATDARFDSSSLAAVGRPHIYPVSRSAVEVDLPPVMDWRNRPLRLPLNEDIALQASNNLGAATESSYGFVWTAPMDWTQNINVSGQRQIMHATNASITSVANQWTGPGLLTFDENIRGGSYAVVGMQCWEANVLACRLVFPKNKLVNGRRFKPGTLCNNALADRPFYPFFGGFGEFGRFSTFELPSLEIFAGNAAAHVVDVFLDTIYLGKSTDLYQ